MQMKAKEAVAKIEEIMGLEYNGFGEPLDHLDRFAMIFGVLERYKADPNKNYHDARSRG